MENEHKKVKFKVEVLCTAWMELYNKVVGEMGSLMVKAESFR